MEMIQFGRPFFPICWISNCLRECKARVYSIRPSRWRGKTDRINCFVCRWHTEAVHYPHEILISINSFTTGRPQNVVHKIGGVVFIRRICCFDFVCTTSACPMSIHSSPASLITQCFLLFGLSRYTTNFLTLFANTRNRASCPHVDFRRSYPTNFEARVMACRWEIRWSSIVCLHAHNLPSLIVT